MIADIHPIIIPTPFLVGPVNVYLLDGAEPALLDAGPNTPEAMSALREGLAAHGHSLSDIRHLVITHSHPDHFGMAARIVAESGARVYSHRYNADRLAAGRPDGERHDERLSRLFEESGVPASVMAGMQKDFDTSASYTEPLAVDVALDEGDALHLGGRDWTVLHTPGHARGHACLFDRDSRTLLSGDHLIRDISSNPIVEPPLPGETERPHTLAQYMRSLQRTADMDIAVALPGHGPAITEVRALVAHRLRFHQKRADSIAAILAQKPGTVYDIVQAHFPQMRGMGAFLAVSEVIGHLDVLEEEGRVRSERVDGLRVYALHTPDA